MTRHIFFNDAGEVVQSIIGGHPLTVSMSTGFEYISVAEDVQLTGREWVQDGELKIPPARPSDSHEWDRSSHSWVLNLELARNLRWTKIKQARDAADFGTFEWDGSVFDCDEVSQSRIQGAVQMAQLALMQGQPFEVDWTLFDDTVRTLTGPQMVNVGLAMGAHVLQQHAIGRGLRQAIAAASTLEAIEAVIWPT